MTSTPRNISHDCEQLAPRLRAIRRNLGLRQEDLAERLTAMGVRIHRVSLAKIEKGTRPLQLPEAVAYAELAGITVEQLVDPAPLQLTVLA